MARRWVILKGAFSCCPPWVRRYLSRPVSFSPWSWCCSCGGSAARDTTPVSRFTGLAQTDRLYRNFPDYSTLTELDVEIHFVKENLILTKESRSGDKYNHGLSVLNAKRYIDNLSEEVKKGVRTKAAQGLWPSYAPMGYLNTLRSDGKRIIVPDPLLGPIVTQLFDWFVKGEFSLKTLRFRKGFASVRARVKSP